MDSKYDIKGIAKEIRKQLKKEFPRCKFSVRIERYSGGQSLYVSLMSAPFEAFTSDMDANGNPRSGDYAQLNYYQLRQEPDEYICNGNYITKEAWDTMVRVDEIQKGYNWDNSDLQTDYFDVNFYFNPSVGQWNKPFQVTEPKPQAEKIEGANGTESGKIEVKHDGDWTWIFFPSKPPAEVREAVKGLGARWSKKRSGWYIREHVPACQIVATIS